MDKDEDIALVAACREGDRVALETLVRRFEKPVYNAAYRMLGNADEAADVTQATFLKLIENIHRFNPQFRLFSWIYRIAINEALDQLYRRRRLEPFEETSADDGDATDDTVAQFQLSKGVQRVLMELSEEHRVVIVLRYFSESSYAQIGEMLDLPEKTVKSRLFSARRDLKARLESHGILSP
ncbi:MAG TPA: RNA polymerase sigma factor [Woeseiaceae bacterium]|nr:RNA polymerase sigma factor [Woeseiaceae bacterium]